MFEYFSSLLMQADIIESVGVVLGSVATIVMIVLGFYTNRIRSVAKAQGRQLNETERKRIADAELGQLVAQKVQEQMAEGKVVARTLYHMATTEDQRKIVERDVKPIVDTAGERVQVIEKQIPFFTKQLEVNVNDNPDVPRESEPTLAVVNKIKEEAKAGTAEPETTGE